LLEKFLDVLENKKRKTGKIVNSDKDKYEPTYTCSKTISLVKFAILGPNIPDTIPAKSKNEIAFALFSGPTASAAANLY